MIYVACVEINALGDTEHLLRLLAGCLGGLFVVNAVAVAAVEFDSLNLLRVAFSRLKQDIHFEPVGFELLPEVFTLPQLQNLYESILEVKFDRRNFANKMKHYEILAEVPDEAPRHVTRTPVKYRFNKENYDRLKSKGFQLEF